MPSSALALAPDSVVVGWDFSTSGAKCLAFDLAGNVLARVHLDGDQWFGHPEVAGLRELSVMQLEGQVRASVRVIADELRKIGRLRDWVAGGISATHHTAGRLDARRLPLRRLICWNDTTLIPYHKKGLKRLGGPAGVQKLIGGPWAVRYSLSHLVKDEECLDAKDWERTVRILPHGPMAAGLLTSNYDVTSVSSAASTGIMDFRSRRWAYGMLKAIKSSALQALAKKQLPEIVDQFTAVGRLAPDLAAAAGIPADSAPWIYPTSDDQQAGLAGGGAVESGQVAIVLGTSAVVNSSGAKPPAAGSLDVMCLNWGPYLWMRCYSNGAGLITHFFGKDPPFATLEKGAAAVPAGCDGVRLLPFLDPEPSLKVNAPALEWTPSEPKDAGVKFRACLEAIAYLIAMGVREHEKAGQKITQLSVSGGIARSDLMCRILATVLNRDLERLESDEGPALGAAATAMAAAETNARRAQGNRTPFPVSAAVRQMVRFRETVQPDASLTETYRSGLKQFQADLKVLRSSAGK